MARRALEYALGNHPDAGITTETRLGHPTRAIPNRTDAVDAFVIGSHGGSSSDRPIVGNVARKEFRRSHVPVIAAR